MSSWVCGELNDDEISSLNRFTNGVNTGVVGALLRDLD